MSVNINLSKLGIDELSPMQQEAVSYTHLTLPTTERV